MLLGFPWKSWCLAVGTKTVGFMYNGFSAETTKVFHTALGTVPFLCFSVVMLEAQCRPMARYAQGASFLMLTKSAAITQFAETTQTIVFTYAGTFAILTTRPAPIVLTYVGPHTLFALRTHALVLTRGTSIALPTVILTFIVFTLLSNPFWGPTSGQLGHG